MYRIINKLSNLSNKVSLISKSIIQIIKAGGIANFEIGYINQGSILMNKRVLVTGGGRGIGLAIAKKFLEQGATVLITGRDKKQLEDVCKEINNESLKYFVWDVTRFTEVSQNISNVQKMLGGDIDILINNAGIIGNTRFQYITENDWDEVYSVNSKAVFFITQEICKKWVEKKSRSTKKIINISSQGGFVGALYPYRMTKWDVAGLTQGLGIAMANEKIIVNGIAPGIVATRMQPGYNTEDGSIYCHHTPLQRLALPEEIAELALFLASDSSNFIVGQTIVCDGGFSLK